MRVLGIDMGSREVKILLIEDEEIIVLKDGEIMK